MLPVAVVRELLVALGKVAILQSTVEMSFIPITGQE